MSAGWTNRASGLRNSCALLLAPLCGGAERPGPPQTQGVVLSGLLRWHHSFASLAVGGRVTLAIGGPRELTLPAGGCQQWHEGMNTEEEKDGWNQEEHGWSDKKSQCFFGATIKDYFIVLSINRLIVWSLNVRKKWETLTSVSQTHIYLDVQTWNNLIHWDWNLKSTLYT